MKKWLPLLLCFLIPSAFAGLYKWVDADGNVHYTDHPPPQGAEEVTLPPTVTYKPTSIPAESAPTEPGAKEVVPYQGLTISTPKMNETIRSNTGEVSVQFSLTPNGLNKGDKFRLMVDGKALEQEFTQPQVVLRNVDRGSHTVQVHAVNAAGQVEISSQSVIFHLRRESELSSSSSSSSDNSEAYTPGYAQDPNADKSSEYKNTGTPNYDKGIPQHPNGSDYSPDVTDPADSRDTVYDPTYRDTSSSGKGFKPGSSYTPNYNQKQ